MKNLHNIKSTVPNWIKAWLWWNQAFWNDTYVASYNSKGAYFKSKMDGMIYPRESVNLTVLETWNNKNNPEPNWSLIKYIGDKNAEN